MNKIINWNQFINEDKSNQPMLKYRNIRMVDMQDWDNLVEKTYGKPYSIQQQDGCRSRGIINISVPDESYDEEMNDSIPEEINGEEMGVKFRTWLNRDPQEPIQGRTDYAIRLFWHRNFYPDLGTLANDLYEKGLIEAGEYSINIDW